MAVMLIHFDDLAYAGSSLPIGEQHACFCCFRLEIIVAAGIVHMYLHVAAAAKHQKATIIRTSMGHMDEEEEEEISILVRRPSPKDIGRFVMVE